MIDYIIGGEYINIHSNKGAQPYINMGNNQPMIGAMSYDSASQSMKVYDGSAWLVLGGGSATINLAPNAIAALKWAEQKMAEEYELKALCEKHPSIKSIVDQMNSDIATYHHKILMVKALIKEEEKVGTS